LEWLPNASRPSVFESSEALRIELWGAVVFAGMALFAGLTNVAVQGLSSWRLAKAMTSLGGPIATLSPVVVLLCLPPEDPYTGSGSPLARVLTLVMFGPPLVMFFTIPSMWLVWICWSETIQRRGNPAVVA
jgi:hypothetical protein